MQRKAVAKTNESPSRGSHVPTQSARSASAAHPMLALQRSIGNSATQRLIRSPYIQAKLQVSTPDDPLEEEADRTAETVMRIPEPNIATQVQTKPLSTQITRLAQRDTDEADEEEKVVAAKSKSHVPLAVREDDEEGDEVPVHRACAQSKEEAHRLGDEPEDEEVINRKDGGAKKSGTQHTAARPAVSNTAARNIHALNGGGNPLPAVSRAFFEPRFGADLSKVRVHTDSRAAETAKSINAKAFTVGTNITFGAGQYEPHSQEGQRLLAHELTHVVQQSGADGNSVRQKKENCGESAISQPVAERRAVPHSVQRAPAPPAQTKTPAGDVGASASGKRKGSAPRSRDVRTMTEEELRREAERKFAENERPGISRTEWERNFERQMEISEELERLAKEAENSELAAVVLERLQAMIAQAERTSADLKEKVELSIEALNGVSERIAKYLGRYEEAYDKFVGVLVRTKFANAARNERFEMISGVIVGTGLGLGAGAIFSAAKGAYRVIVEAVAEIAELFVSKVGAPSESDAFTPPANVHPKLLSIPAGERLMDAWRGLAKFNLTTHALGQYQLALQKLAYDLERDPTKARVNQSYQMVSRGHMENIQGKIDEQHDKVFDFVRMSHHPSLKRNERELEQDMWISWIAALKNDEESIVEALDDDIIEDYLEEIGVLGDDGRLGIDFGWSTGRSDTQAGYKRALNEENQLKQVGRYGVAGGDIGPKGLGTVRILNDLHKKLGKPEERKGPEATFPAVLWSTDVVKMGQIVRVMGTSSKGLEVQPALDQNADPVFM